MDIYIFIERLEDLGIQFIREEMNYGIRVRIYEGSPKKMVLIDMSEEDITPMVGKGHLKELGLSDYIPSFFPSEVINQTQSVSSDNSSD